MFRVISLIEFFILTAMCMYILDSLIVTWRQASTEKILITILEKISLPDLNSDSVDKEILKRLN